MTFQPQTSRKNGRKNTKYKKKRCQRDREKKIGAQTEREIKEKRERIR